MEKLILMMIPFINKYIVVGRYYIKKIFYIVAKLSYIWFLNFIL